MANLQQILLLFTKFPRPGFSKTRLIPRLGPENAANLQRRMTQKILATINTLSPEINLEIHYTGGSLKEMQDWLGKALCYKMQLDAPLGERMKHGIQPHLTIGKSVVVIGADCPDITAEILNTAFESLNKSQVTIGPSYDGGYYLLGINRNFPQDNLDHLLQDILWGSAKVFSQTMARVSQHNLKYHLLPKLHDIDTPEDLQHINYHTDSQ
jgi:uncharacterized protein